MERNAYGFALPVKLTVVMVALFSAVFLANATLSQAASTKKKTAAPAITYVEQTEHRIKELNTALKITEGQQLLWNNVTLVMQENARGNDALGAARTENRKTMTAVEQVIFHSQVTEAQLAQQKKFIPPFEALYASLSDDQKTTLDTIFRTGKHGKHLIR